MNKKAWIPLVILGGLLEPFGARPCSAQDLSPRWEDLTSPDFAKAIQKAGGVFVLPLGSIDKFGPSGPLGTSLYTIRLMALEAVKQEYAIVFPAYFVSLTNGVSNHPGTIAYSSRLQHDMLHETTRKWRGMGAGRS